VPACVCVCVDRIDQEVTLRGGMNVFSSSYCSIDSTKVLKGSRHVDVSRINIHLEMNFGNGPSATAREIKFWNRVVGAAVTSSSASRPAHTRTHSKASVHPGWISGCMLMPVHGSRSLWRNLKETSAKPCSSSSSNRPSGFLHRA
jgi:hypothetical protein